MNKNNEIIELLQTGLLTKYVSIDGEKAVKIAEIFTSTIASKDQEIALLREELQKTRLDHITTLGELQTACEKIAKMRTAGDSYIAAHIAAKSSQTNYVMDQLHIAWLNWQEARREQ